MYGDSARVDERGIHLTFEIGYKPSIISLDSLTDYGQEQVIRFSFTDTASGAKWSGEMPFQYICDAWEERQK